MFPNDGPQEIILREIGGTDFFQMKHQFGAEFVVVAVADEVHGATLGDFG